jgi:F1F0 ATPase subunit 2
MRVTDLLALAAAGGAGLALGLAYFGGLWWTVRRLPDSPAPWRLLLASAAVRLACLLAGFFVVTAGRWENAVACLAGVLLARAALVRRWTGPPPEGQP